MTKIWRNVVLIFVLIFILMFGITSFIKNNESFISSRSLNITDYNVEGTTEITGEITKERIVTQKFKNYIPDLTSIELQFATFGDRNNKGNIFVKILCDDIILANSRYDSSKIKDGEYLKIPLDKDYNTKNKEIVVEVFSDECIEGSSVTLWMSQNKIGNSSVSINGVETNKTLNMKFNYYSPRFIYLFAAIVILLMVILVGFGIDIKIYNKYKTDLKFNKLMKKYKKYFILIIFAIFILSIRNLNFITEPTIYAEDGVYISNILNNGLLKSMFSTRGGGAADFQNSGSYLILYISLIINKFINGYNLSYLPMYIGIISNLFFSLVAVTTYIALKPTGKYLAITSYLVCILVPMGKFGGEILGRTLNTVFIWPVFTAMLMIILYRNKNYFLNIIIGILSILAGLSFPISYGIVGIYLCYTFFLSIIKKKSIFIWIKNNVILIINVMIGLYLLPSMIKSEGITSEMIMNPNSIIEFSIVRHILYPFISPLYTFFNDKIAIIIFLIYIGVIIYVAYVNIREKKLEDSYFLVLIFTLVYWIASVGMRIKMTALFNKYQSSFPDRYFYACNILSFILLLYAINFLLEKQKIKQEIKHTIKALFIIILLINPYLFELAKSDIKLLGGYNAGTFKQCINRSVELNNFNEENGTFNIEIYPKNWSIELPYIYVLSTK